MTQKFKVVFFTTALMLVCFVISAHAASTLAVRTMGGSRIQKADGNVASYLNRLASQGAGIEQLQQGKYTILLSSSSAGQYDVQVYRIVAVGKKRVMSTFLSVFRAGIEYSYRYDSSSGDIKQHHYICPPDSLTCWANPGDYASMKQFSWQENYPGKNCSQSVFTSEEYGREYLQASCFGSRDAALSFAQKFIQYVTGPRGM